MYCSWGSELTINFIKRCFTPSSTSVQWDFVDISVKLKGAAAKTCFKQAERSTILIYEQIIQYSAWSHTSATAVTDLTSPPDWCCCKSFIKSVGLVVIKRPCNSLYALSGSPCRILILVTSSSLALMDALLVTCPMVKALKTLDRRRDNDLIPVFASSILCELRFPRRSRPIIWGSLPLSIAAAKAFLCSSLRNPDSALKSLYRSQSTSRSHSLGQGW